MQDVHTTPPPRRRLPLVSLRTGMIIATLMAKPLPYFAYRIETAQLEQRAVERLNELDAAHEFNYDTVDDGFGEPSGPQRIRSLLGPSMLDHVTRVFLSPRCAGKLKCLRGLPNCEDVIASEIALSEDDLSQIGRMRSLRLLSAPSCGITDAKLRHLAKAESLKSITLNSNAITGIAFASLRNIPLEVVYLVDTNLDDDGANALAEIKSVKHLYVSSDRLTAKGVLALAAMHNLEELFIGCPGATDETVTVLPKLLPKTKITVIPD